MDEKIRKQIKKIIGYIECPQDCKCVDSCFDHLFKATDQGIEVVLRCNSENRSDCPHEETLGNDSNCKCPVRAEIAKKLNY